MTSRRQSQSLASGPSASVPFPPLWQPPPRGQFCCGRKRKGWQGSHQPLLRALPGLVQSCREGKEIHSVPQALRLFLKKNIK